MLNYDAELRNWVEAQVGVGSIFVGKIYNDRKGRWPDGTTVHTSMVMFVTGDLVQTRNTVYKLIGEANEPTAG